MGKYVKTFETFITGNVQQNNLDISNIIENEIEEFDLPPIEINSGECFNFAESIANKYSNYGIVCLNGLDFFESFESNELEDAIDVYGEENLIIADKGVWKKEYLEKYGYPKIDLYNFYDRYMNHGWFFYNGKHYDAENIEGVDYWYELTCWKRFGIILY